MRPHLSKTTGNILDTDARIADGASGRYIQPRMELTECERNSESTVPLLCGEAFGNTPRFLPALIFGHDGLNPNDRDQQVGAEDVDSSLRTHHNSAA